MKTKNEAKKILKERNIVPLFCEFNPYKLKFHIWHFRKTPIDLRDYPFPARLKKNFTKTLVVGLVSTVALFTLVNKAMQLIGSLMSKNIDSREVQAPTLFLSELNDVDKENPSTPASQQQQKNNKELLTAVNYLNNRLVNDVMYFGEHLETIDHVKSICFHNVANESLSKDCLIDVLFEENGTTYVLQYSVFENDLNSFDFEKQNSDGDLILNFAGLLQLCYPNNLIKQEAGSEDSFITEPFEFNESATNIIFKIPVYEENSCTVYEIPESVVAETADDVSFESVMNLFNSYQNHENDLFDSDSIEEASFSKKLKEIYNKTISSLDQSEIQQDQNNDIIVTQLTGIDK